MAKSISNLLDLHPLHLPEAPSWWPPAWGWVGLVAGIVVSLLFIFWLIKRYFKRLAPKKVALRLLQPMHGKLTPSEAIEFLRQAALYYYARQDIAHLTGHEWYQFLDSQLEKPLFIPNESLWQTVLYKNPNTEDTQHLIEDCCTWVQEALPPKRRYRR